MIASSLSHINYSLDQVGQVRSSSELRKGYLHFAQLILMILRVLFCICFLTNVSNARSSWDIAIEKAEVFRDEMNKKADALGYSYALGSIYNEHNVKEHTCAILGRMLGKTSLIGHLEEPLPKNSEDGFEFRLAAHSLDNWIFTVRRLQKMPKTRKIRAWNLDCVGSNGIPVTANISDETSEAFYDLSEDGKTIHILGPVTEGFYLRFVTAINDNKEVTTVALGSGGGLVREAILTGLEIRKRNLETTLWNNCYSACPLVFIAGTKRTIWSPYPELGFHRISVNGLAISLDSPMYDLIRDYAKEMDVNSAALIDFMSQAEPSGILNPSSDALCKARIATWVQRVCWVD